MNTMTNVNDDPHTQFPASLVQEVLSKHAIEVMPSTVGYAYSFASAQTGTLLHHHRWLKIPETVRENIYAELEDRVNHDLVNVPLHPATPPPPAALAKQVGGTHYKDDAIQHVEYCQRNKFTWCESSAMKYIVRHRKKNGAQDINKAIHYLEMLKQIEYPGQ